MELLLFLAIVFIFIFIIGRFLEKIRIPWVFAGLLIGLVLSPFTYFHTITNSPNFIFLSNLGMYFLLFIIGFDLDIDHILRSGKFIIKTTFAVILSEALVTSIFVHFLFHLPWIISILLGLSFATIGEEILLPILEEFGLVKTRLGQTILSVGVLDDFIEVITIILISILLGYSYGYAHLNVWLNILVLFMLIGLVFVLSKFHKYFYSFKFKKISSFFLIAMSLLFLFIGIGKIVQSSVLGAILAGIAIKTIMPKKVLKFIESEVRTLAYGLLAPIFFLSVGINVNLNYIINYPWLIISITLLTYITKAFVTYLITKKELGKKNSLLLGISFCVRFSTSIVILKILVDHAFISPQIYTIFIGTQIIFKFIIPIILAYLFRKWSNEINATRPVITA